ncbi:MAG: TolC family protein [Nannocystaceae bacterium]|nr:TolC family protein [Nannocystaceae bacterium]
MLRLLRLSAVSLVGVSLLGTPSTVAAALAATLEEPAAAPEKAPAQPSLPPSPTEATAPTGSPERSSAFDAIAHDRLDSYGTRPSDASRLSLDQIVRYSLDNPAVKSAEEDVTAMRAQLRKAQFAWIPIIETSAVLSPGVNIRCDDVNLDDGSTEGFDFQYCRTRDDNNFDVNTIDGYFSQLADAGVRFEFRADMLIPITTFGKIRNTRKLAEVGVALRELKKDQVEQETVLRVQQAYAALLLARDTISILREANGIVDTAQRRVEKDLGGGDEDWDAEPDEGNELRDPDDLIKVKLASIELQQLMRQALNVESYALSALWALAGDAAPPGFDVRARKLLRMELPGGLQRPQDYKQMAAARRPEARMASAAVKARQFQEKVARSNFLPDLGIAVSTGVGRSNAVDRNMTQLYYQDPFNWTRFSAALAMRWRWDFHFKTFDLQTARANTRSAMHQEEAAALLLGLDVQQAYGDLIQAKHLVETYGEAVDLSWRLVVSGQQKDSVGGGNASDLLRNLEKWYKRRFDYEQAIYSYNDAVARLSRAVGTQIGREPAVTVP